MTKEAIVLAGGFGTRLQSVVKEVPKPMAPLNEIPFLSYLFRYLKEEGIEHVVLAVGYLREIIIDHYGKEFDGIKVSYAIEEEALGTGGGIWNAFKQIKGDKAFVLNGDTFFDIQLAQMHRSFEANEAQFSLALKPMRDFDRYGRVEVDNSRIVSFHEKEFCKEGMINGGVYLMEKSLFDQVGLSGKFSFEKDFLEAHLDTVKMCAFPFDNYFIDIGIPEDYAQAAIDLKDFFSED